MMDFPSSLSVWGMQALVGLPSISTVQVPQAPSLHPSFTLVRCRVVPQVAQQLLVLFHGDSLSVYGKVRHGVFLLACRAQPWSHGRLVSFRKG